MEKQSPKPKRARKPKKNAEATPPNGDSKQYVPPDVARALIKFHKDSKEAEASILRSIYG